MFIYLNENHRLCWIELNWFRVYIVDVSKNKKKKMMNAGKRASDGYRALDIYLQWTLVSAKMREYND